jgi:hypothetical protein
VRRHEDVNAAAAVKAAEDSSHPPEPFPSAFAAPEDRSEEPDPRRCAFVKNDGTRCKAWKVKSESLCAGHLGRGIAADPQAYGKAAAAKAAELRVSRAEDRKRTPTEVYANALNEHAERFVEARLAIVDDPKASASDKLGAMRDLENRALGRPKETQVHEVEIPEDWAMLDQMSVAELATLYRRLVPDGALLELLPSDEELAQIVDVTDEPLPDQ